MGGVRLAYMRSTCNISLHKPKLLSSQCCWVDPQRWAYCLWQSMKQLPPQGCGAYGAVLWTLAPFGEVVDMLRVLCVGTWPLKYGIDTVHTKHLQNHLTCNMLWEVSLSAFSLQCMSVPTYRLTHYIHTHTHTHKHWIFLVLGKNTSRLSWQTWTASTNLVSVATHQEETFACALSGQYSYSTCKCGVHIQVLCSHLVVLHVNVYWSTCNEYMCVRVWVEVWKGRISYW